MALVFVVHQRVHLLTVVGPGSGDPAVVAVVGRIGIVRTVQDAMAVGPLRPAVDHREQVVVVMGRGQANLAMVIAERPCGCIGNVIVVAAVGGPAEPPPPRPPTTWTDIARVGDRIDQTPAAISLATPPEYAVTACFDRPRPFPG
jgi:hypothetical protein